MLNQAAVEALHSANYLEDYLDYVENLPNDLQRNISTMRELDVKYQEVMKEIERLEKLFASSPGSWKKTVVGMQRALIHIQDIGDEKLNIVQHIQDITENKFRKIDSDFKNLDFGQEHDTNSDQLNKELNSVPERASKRSRRQRNTDSISESNIHNEVKVEKEVVTVTSSSKKQKKKKRKTKAEREREQRSPSEPIDPDEQTYCLCEQVSYGEMIGCDNENCEIEWFHFSCVQLTNKPKGKWYCPHCRGDRSNQPKPNLGKNSS
ncbi:Inhibitor of growth protein 1 [Nymphon striatum]|nr:Inhibitor of growth protein 1 [Nymphon striatum]